jgi:hypothetical protein
MQSMWMRIGQDDQGGGQAENGQQDQNQGQSKEEVTPTSANMVTRAETRDHRDAMPSTLLGIRFLFPASRRFCALSARQRIIIPIHEIQRKILFEAAILNWRPPG